jgi:hypothetical protein
MGEVLVCATADSGNARNTDASAGITAHPRRSEFENRNKESLRSEKQLRRA